MKVVLLYLSRAGSSSSRLAELVSQTAGVSNVPRILRRLDSRTSTCQVLTPKITSLDLTQYILRKAFRRCGLSRYSSGSSPACVLSLYELWVWTKSEDLYLFWRGPAVITSNTYHISLHPGFLPVVVCTSNSIEIPQT